jgi:glycosyltransferase involved in cell wall biosynthesis
LVQAIKYLEYCIRVYLYYRYNEIKCINIHSLGLLPLGIALKRIWHVPLIYDAHELETEVNGVTHFRKKISKWLERQLIKSVDAVIVVSEGIADWYAETYDIQRPTVVLNAPPRRALHYCNHFREQLGIRSNQAILLYQGGLAHGRGVSLILDAFKSRTDDKIVVVFMGYGPLQKDIQAEAQSQPNIFYYPAVAPDVVLEYTASADMGISLIENTCLSYYYCMPNKLFEYAMAGIPVLVSNMKEMAALVANNAMGAVIEEFTPQAINQAIDALLGQDLTALRANAHATACQYAWEKQEIAMLRVYSDLGFHSNAYEGMA